MLMLPREGRQWKTVALGLLCAGLSGLWSFADDTKGERRSQALGAFSRGDTLSWDQLEVVAGDAGLSQEKLAEIKLKDRIEGLIRHYNLRLEMSGFSNAMAADEEFRLFKGRRPGWGGLLFNAAFWSKRGANYGTDEFYLYLLFRAEAYYLYRSHYDSEHCAWIVEEESPSMQILKAALAGSQSNWIIDEGPPTGRDLEFRRSLDPTHNPSRTLKALTEYALRAVAQKAADDWAEFRYRKNVGQLPSLVMERVRQRERALAVDFGHARGAMTRAERLTFQRLLKSPFRYARTQGAPASDPTYDPATKTP